MKKKFQLALATVLASLLVLTPTVANAAEPNGSQGQWKKTWSTCSSDGVYTTIGGQVWLKEFYKQGVRQFKVEYTVRAGSSTSWNNPVLRKKTYTSNKFPNNKTSYQWKAPSVKWTNLTSGVDGGYWLYAKLTWKRPHKKDWNVKNFLLRACSPPASF
ncbi:MAG: hypothetical protein ACK5LO_04995 [Leucobacter sp.]